MVHNKRRLVCESSAVLAMARRLQPVAMMRYRLFAFSLFLSGALDTAGQTVQFGAIGGFTATKPDVFSSGESRRYLIGPSVEARLFGGKLGVEVDAVYRRFGESFAAEFGPPPPEFTGPALTRFSMRSRTNSWEFPLLGKYYFRDAVARWRPFLGTGYVLRLQWRETTSTTYRTGEASALAAKDSSTAGPDVGAAIVAGVALRGIARMSLQPQIRYTRWSRHTSFDRPLNQVDIGLGIRF